MDGLYKVVRKGENTHIGGGGPRERVIMTGSEPDCWAECVRRNAARDTSGSSVSAILSAADFYVVEPAEPGDKVS